MSPPPPVLRADAVRLGLSAADRWEAVRLTGRILVDVGAVPAEYVDAMCQRERSVSTYVGRGVAIPHGTAGSRGLVRRAALAVAQFPDGVAWGGTDRVVLCVGIAAADDQHLGVLSRLAALLEEEAGAQQLLGARAPEEILAALDPLRR